MALEKCMQVHNTPKAGDWAQIVTGRPRGAEGPSGR
jgi:hypothetical protein